MQDPAEEVDIGPLNGLVLEEEVVRHKADTVRQIGGGLLLGRLDNGLEVLDDKREGGILASDGEAGKPLRAADLRDYLSVLIQRYTNVEKRHNLRRQLSHFQALPRGSCQQHG